MAKKFGKFLLATAAIAGAAAAFLYLQKKETANTVPEEDDADYDDFSEDLEETSRNYVPLTKETVAEPENVEEFFDEEDV